MSQKPGGVGVYFGPVAAVEVHTSTCAHCQKITEFPSLRVMHQRVDICRGCMKLVCLNCAGGVCRPWEREMERQEARRRFFADAGIG